MANVNVTSDAWTEISITSGTIQNISATADIELSAEQTDNSGVVLKPSEIYQWDNETIYARAVTEDTGALRVVNFKRATGGGGAGEKTPVGTIISFMGTSAPTNYLACDGTAYNIADYQTLADHITAQFGAVDFFGGDGVSTFAVPDLRGEFLRGTGTNSHTNQGNGSNVGVHQDGTEQLYFFTTNSNIGVRTKSLGDHNVVNQDNFLEENNISYQYANNDSSGTSSGTEYAYTSRPTNTSVLYCIKYQ